MKSKFNKLYQNILLEQIRINIKRGKGQYDCLTIDEYMINEQSLINSLNNIQIINESDDPKYYLIYPKELYDLTQKKANQFITIQDLRIIFPQFKYIYIPNIFIAYIDFNDKDQINTFLNSLSKFNNNSINTACNLIFQHKDYKGLFIDSKQYGLKFSIMLLNRNLYETRTIYHEWTHIFQTYIGNDFIKLIEKSSIKIQKINKQLKKFNLTKQMVDLSFFSQKEYITRLDNLLFAIHQIQKIDTYKDLSDQQFFELFKNTFSTNKPECLKTQLANQFDKKNYKIDLLFFISCFICFKKDLFLDLCEDLKSRI